MKRSTEAVMDTDMERSIEANIFVSKANLGWDGGQRVATVTLGPQNTEALLVKGCLKIGCVSRRIQPNLVVPRCLMSLGFGHMYWARLYCILGSENHQVGICRA